MMELMKGVDFDEVGLIITRLSVVPHPTCAAWSGVRQLSYQVVVYLLLFLIN